MGITVPIEEIRRCRRAFVDRGYRDIIWIKPNTNITGDGSPPEMLLSEFRQLWTPEFEQPLARYCELMAAKPKPRISSSRFHDPGKPLQDELKRIRERQQKGLLIDELVEEIHELRKRLTWAHYRILAETDPPAAAYDSPVGFIIGNPKTRDEAIWNQWCLSNRGTTFSDDFRPWLEVVRA